MLAVPSPDGGPPVKKQRQKKNVAKKSAEITATELVEEEVDLNTVEGSGRGTNDNRYHKSHQCLLNSTGCHGCQFLKVLSNVYKSSATDSLTWSASGLLSGLDTYFDHAKLWKDTVCYNRLSMFSGQFSVHFCILQFPS